MARPTLRAEVGPANACVVRVTAIGKARTRRQPACVLCRKVGLSAIQRRPCTLRTARMGRVVLNTRELARARATAHKTPPVA